MCGIAGVVSAKLTGPSRVAAVNRMCDALAHRGPDDFGTITLGSATLGMRRLAVFDPANGRQPIISPDGRLTLVFNGAIYNHRQLRTELQHAGWEFKTSCDTEVLLAALYHWGESCLSRLRGMFAFAAWDRVDESLLIARDPFGIKPLYIHHAAQHVAFASELNALIASGITPADLDPASMADYLAWLSIPAPRTIYRNVVSLRPGEAARFHHGQLTRFPTWSLRGIPADISICRSADEFKRELRLRLEDSISAHLLADVPVGAFLSGGIDSAAIVGLMRHVGGHAPRTFAITFDESAFSEESAATETARHFETQHVNQRLNAATLVRDLDTIITAMDQPTGDGINAYYAAQAARAGGVTVALSGLGGDELFGGYPSFTTTPKIGLWLARWNSAPTTFRRAVIGSLRHGGTRARKLADLLAYARTTHEAAALQRRLFSVGAQCDLFTPDVRHAIGPSSALHPALQTLAPEVGNADPLSVVSAWETRTYMADLLLRDSDVMSMRHSLELRVPFVDRPLIEWLWRQPAEFRFGRPGTKSALRHAVDDLLPPALHSRPKRGFSLPMPVWMRHELRPFLEDSFAPANVGQSGIFEPRQVERIWRGYLRRDDRREWSRVWSLAMLLQFVRRKRQASTAPTTAAITIRPPLASHARSRTFALMAPEIFGVEGGISRILQTYLKALAEIACTRQGQVRLVALNDATIPQLELPPAARTGLGDIRVCSRSKPRFVRATLAVSRGVDHLICGHVAQLPVAWLLAQLQPGLRYSLIAHGIEVWRSFNYLERRALRHVHRVICVSDYTRRELLRHFNLPADRIVVLPNALDPSFTIATGEPLATCAPVILAVGRLNHADSYKGFDHLIAAMPAIRAEIPEAALRIIGRGDDLKRLTKLRDQLGLAAAVQFLGYVTDNQLRDEFGRCRLFALPSAREGFGLVYVEAMAHGRPCLAARSGGATEVVTPESGVLVNFGDVPALARAAVHALRHPWDGEAILQRAESFSFANFQEKLAALLG